MRTGRHAGAMSSELPAIDLTLLCHDHVRAATLGLLLPSSPTLRETFTFVCAGHTGLKRVRAWGALLRVNSATLFGAWRKGASWPSPRQTSILARPRTPRRRRIAALPI